MLVFFISLFIIGFIIVMIGLSGVVGRLLGETKKMNDNIIKNKKAQAGLFVILGIIFIIIGISGGISNYYTSVDVGRDTTAWLNRAQVASNPEDMAEYLEKCRDGMIEWELTDGDSILFFATPEHDMELVMAALESNLERCYKIQEMDPYSPEYQTALDDVRGAIRELNLQAVSRYWTKNWLLDHTPLFLICIGIALFVSLIILVDIY